LLDKEIKNTEEVTKQIKQEFINNPNWKTSEKEIKRTKTIYLFCPLTEEDDLDKVANLIEELFNHLFIAFNFIKMTKWKDKAEFKASVYMFADKMEITVNSLALRQCQTNGLHVPLMEI